MNPAMNSVLVVDDEKSFRVIAEEALVREGYAVRTAGSGAAGKAAFFEDPPDVVILDRNLPDIDGVELLACSRKRRRSGASTRSSSSRLPMPTSRTPSSRCGRAPRIT